MELNREPQVVCVDVMSPDVEHDAEKEWLVCEGTWDKGFKNHYCRNEENQIDEQIVSKDNRIEEVVVTKFCEYEVTYWI